MHIDVEVLIQLLEEKKGKILVGLANKNLNHDDTMFERGKFTELNNIISGLKEEAASNSR